MANFDTAKGSRGGGFNSAAYSMTIAQHSRRAVWLVGQGPGGALLNVAAASSNILRVQPAGSSAFSEPLPPSTTEFWIDGLLPGVTKLHARTPGGGDYSAPLAVTVTGTNDMSIMESAFRDSRATIRQTVADLSSLSRTLTHSMGGLNILRGLRLSTSEREVLNAVVFWLNVPDHDPRLGPTEHKMWVTKVVRTIASAVALFTRNLAFQPDYFVRVPEGFHANVWGRKELGIECGESFFSHDGPRCRQDVMTHEIMHLFGIGHGIDPASGPTIHRQGITPEQSLNSADNLAQLAAQITAGKTDACTRANE